MVEYSSEKFSTNANLDFDEMTYMYKDRTNVFQYKAVVSIYNYLHLSETTVQLLVYKDIIPLFCPNLTVYIVYFQ